MSKIIKMGLFLSFLMLSIPAFATPAITQNESHYPVTGNTVDELLAQMKMVGPTADGAHFDAVTEYFVKWDTTYLETSGSCQITNARVSLFLTSKFPQWTNYAAGDKSTQQRWDSFLVNIRQHEQGHSNHGIEAAREVEAMIAGLPAMESCGKMEAIVKDKTNAILSKYKTLDSEYDRMTNHGANQHYA